MQRVVTLLTDFGTADGYVAEMKGVLLSRVAGVTIVDASHDVEPQDVHGARLALARYWRRYPEGTVHLVVVDPGVGTERAALAVASDGRFLVGPDNGVLSPALLLPGARVIELPVPPQASATFHGRDLFAPAAAALATAMPLDALGAPAVAPLVLRTPQPQRNADGTITGAVITLDRFGNAITNLAGVRASHVLIAGARVPVERTYGDVESGSAVALVGSSGLLEIAVRDGSAAERLGLRRGSEVVVDG